MKSQNNQQFSYNSSQERLSEIGKILFQGIKRLKSREDQKNNPNQLDSNFKRSVHDVSNNLNREAI